MTWTIRNPEGAVAAQGPTRTAAIAKLTGQNGPGRNTAWIPLRRAGWTARQDPRPGGAKRPVAVYLAETRAERNARVERVVQAAIDEALIDGYQWITREAVAQRAGVSNATVSNACGGMRALKRRVMTEAVRRPIPEIVAQGLADGSDIARDAPPAVKEAARLTLA
jgi:hypothetical protein